MKSCSEYRAHSKAALSGRWSAVIIFFLVYTVVTIVANAFFGAPQYAFMGDQVMSNLWGGATSILAMLFTIPLQYGYNVAFLKYFRNRDAQDIPFSDLFEGFRDYVRVLGTILLMVAYVLLWTCLLIIPGIIKAYSYKMTPYILKDHPEMSYNAAIEESMRLMNGHKMDLFLLELSYIGWGLLCILTCGIALLWVAPWMQMAEVDFYEDLLAEDAAKAAAKIA